MSLLDRISEANRLDPTGLVPFEVADRRVGLTNGVFAERLSAWREVFTCDDGVLRLSPDLSTMEDRSRAVAPILAVLRNAGHVPGWRGELYPVFVAPDAPPLLLVERATAPLFGICTRAVNLNGYVEHPDGSLSVWLQRRSMNRPTSPGKLDVIVSGGQPFSIDPLANLVKECGEEAGIPEDWARNAVPAGAIRFRARRPDGIHHGHYLVYDLALPPDFRPDNRDGEVQAFHCWSAEKVIKALDDSEDIAFDSTLILIDFLIRHGVIGPDYPGYGELVNGVRP